MNYFLMPITLQSITIGSRTRTANAPKYLATDMAGLAFSCISFGLEGIGIVGLQNANPALTAEPDVYTIPDLTTTLADSDVAALSAYLTPLNVPVDQIVSGMTWSNVLQVVATIFLVAQAIAGATGSSLFGDGSTLNSAIGDTTAAAVVPSQNLGGKGKMGGTVDSGASSQLGPFDLSGVSASDTVGDTLDTLSQQFTSEVVL